MLAISVSSLASCSELRMDASAAAVNTGVFVHGSQVLVSGVIKSDADIQPTQSAVQEEEELEESADITTDEDEDWDTSDGSAEFDSGLPTARIQGGHPGAALLMNLGAQVGQVKLPVSLLETSEASWEDESVLDSDEDPDEDPDDPEKAEDSEAKQEKALIMQRALESPEMQESERAHDAVKKAKLKGKKKLKDFDRKEKAEEKKGLKVLDEQKFQDEKLQSEDFSDDKDSKQYKTDGTQMVKAWDKANQPEKEPEADDMAMRGTPASINATEVAPVKPVSWRVKIGMVKNFGSSPRAVDRKIVSLKDMHALDVARIESSAGVKDVAFLLHGHQLSRADLKTGQVKHVAGSSEGLADGSGDAVKFANPSDVAVFADPKFPDQWMVLVADSQNDQLRLVRDPLGAGKTTTVLEQAMVEDPRRVAVVESRQSSPDQIATNARKVFAFVICGKGTVVRVENILGRRKVTTESRAYESKWEKELRLRDKQVFNENARATVHMISTKFMELSDISIAKEYVDGGERIVAFVVDSKAGLLFRLDQIIEGERQARITEIGRTKGRSFLAINSGSSWFGIAGQTGKAHQRLHRVDQVIEGKREGRSTDLHALKQTGTLKALGAMSDWKGKVYAVVDSGSGDSSLMEVDMSQDLVCKDKTLMGSSEFNELGELESLGLVKQTTKPIRLRAWVAAAPVGGNNQTSWRIITFHSSKGRVCGVSSTAGDPKASVFAYFCEAGTCAPA